MKRLVSVMLILVTVCTMVIPVNASSNATAYLVDYSIFMNEQKYSFNDENGRVFPVLLNGSTYLPYDCIAKLFGIRIYVNDSSVVIDSTPFLRINVLNSKATLETEVLVNAIPNEQTVIFHDGNEVNFMDANGMVVYPIYCNGKLYLPVRGISLLLNYSILFESDTNSIYISENAMEK